MVSDDVTTPRSLARMETRAGETERDGLQHDLVLALALAAAVGAFYAAPWPLLYVPALSVVVGLTAYRPWMGILAVIVLAPAFMVPKHLGSKEFPPSEILLAVDVVVVGALRVVRRVRLELRAVWNSPFLWPGLLLLAAGAVSTLAAADHAEGFRAYREDLLEPVLYGGLLLALLRTTYRWKWALGAVLVAGTWVCVLSLWQLGADQNLTWVAGSTIPRVKGLYGSPDNLGLLLDRVLPLWAGLAAGACAQRWGVRWPLLLPGALFAVVLFYTASRGAWAAVGVALVATVLLTWRTRVVVLALAAGCVVAGAVLAGPRVLRAVNSGHSGTVHARVQVWRSAVAMIRDHPVLGVGPDNFLHYYAPTRHENRWQRECNPGLGYIQPDAGAEPCLSHPHDEFLDFWLSTGLAGLLAFLLLEATFWRAAVGAWRRGSPDLRPWVVGTMAGAVAALVHGLVDNSYFLEDLALLFWVQYGFLSFAQSARVTG